MGAAGDGVSTGQLLDDARVRLQAIIDDKFEQAALVGSDGDVERWVRL